MSAEEAILDGIEKSLDEIEPVLEAAEQAVETAVEITKADILITSAVVGALVGGGTYWIVNRMLKKKYREIADKEIAEAKEFYSAMNKREGYSSPMEAAKTMASKISPPRYDDNEAVALYQGREAEKAEMNESDISTEDEGGEEQMVNVFLNNDPSDDEWDAEEEMAYRATLEDGVPFIISEEEFSAGQEGYQQASLTYYWGDMTLADEQDGEIPFVNPIVGEENMYHFGRGSGDERIVYIRNDRLERDFEVVKNDGKYAHIVLGMEHSDGGSRGRRLENDPRKIRIKDDDV